MLPTGDIRGWVITGLRCSADFNDDGLVGIFDLVDFVQCFEGEACAVDRSCDFDGDGFIDIFDFAVFIDKFETGC